MKIFNGRGLVLFVVLALTIVGVRFAYSCTQGCTPGFWKNNTALWVGYSVEQTLGQVFDPAHLWWPASLDFLYDDTLLMALQYPGGPELEGAARIFLRHAVAALLNAAHPDVNGLTVKQVKNMVKATLLSEDRDVCIFKAGTLQYYNELGCPLRALRRIS